MNINYSSTMPMRSIQDNAKRILNYHIKELTLDEIKELWNRTEENVGKEPDSDFIESHKYRYNTLTIGSGQFHYDGIVNAIIRDRYKADQMEAITNNMNIIVGNFFSELASNDIASATNYLINSINNENSSNFKEMHEWRAIAKKEAKLILNI